MKRQGTYGVILAFSILLFSCDDQVDWELKYQQMDLIVVEGEGIGFFTATDVIRDTIVVR